MTGRRRRRGRLALRLYLPVMLTVITTGLIVTVAGYLDHAARMEEAHGEASAETREQLARALTSLIAAERGDRASKQRLADRLERHTRLDLAVYGPDGELWAELGRWSPEPLDRGEVERLRRDGVLHLDAPPRLAVAIVEGGSLLAYGVESPPPHDGSRWRSHPRGMLPGLGRPPYWVPPPVLWVTVVALVLLAVVSALFTRSVARPLSRLSEVARALGEGDLSARARLERKDELGDLGGAFDEMADRLTALLEAQTALLAGASHELRTPLARIRVALDIAAEGDAELAREQLQEIAQDLEELEALVRDILILARLDHGRRSGPGGRAAALRLEPTPLGQVIADAGRRFEAERPERVLELDVPADLPKVEADGVLLGRVLANLLDNAAKYSEPDQKIVLRARSTPGSVEVEVEDQGIGIDAEELEQVFAPFFRSDRSRARATGGVGLGLALARRIVEAHGGTISVESGADGGSTFRLALPAGP